MTTLEDRCAALEPQIPDPRIATAAEVSVRRRTPATVAQLWRGTTRDADCDLLARIAQARIQAALAESKACRGAYLLQRAIGRGEAETLVLTLYEGGCIRGGAACEPELPALSDAEKRLLLTDQGSVAYDVLTDPGRMRLYADLGRRFPRRMMAPR